MVSLVQLRVYMKSQLLIACLAFLLVGCGSDEDSNSSSGDRPLSYNRSLQPLLDQNGLSAQEFTIDNTKDTVIIGAKGTIIKLDANTFDGNSDRIDLELIEAPDLSDLLLLNAQTVSDNKLLQTDGVIYLQATSSGQTVAVAEGKSVEIKLPSSNVDTEMSAFVGEYDETGNINWKEGNNMSFDSSAAEYNKLMASGMFEIPFKLFPYRQEYYRMDSLAQLYPTKNGVVKAPVRGYLVSADRAKFYSKLIEIIESSKYKSTHLATREFAERLYRLQYIDHTYSYDSQGEDGLFEMTSDRYALYQHGALKIYEANLDKPLWYSDSLVYQFIKNFFPKYFDKPHYATYKVQCEEQKQYFLDYYEDGMTGLLEIKDNGIDLSADDALEKLIKSGISPEEANFNMQLHKKQQEVIKALKKDDQAFIASLKRKEEWLKQERAMNQIKYYVVTAQELGWINVDRFYNDQNAEEVNILAKVNEPEGAEFISVSMVFPELNSFLTGYEEGNGTYRFNEDKEFYNRLPIGERAYVVAISYKDGQPYLGMEEFYIGDSEEIPLFVSNVSMEEFKDRLSGLN